jgi:hypothetical protein
MSDNLMVIINPAVAKQLCKKGFHIVDIKQSKYKEGKPSVFLFDKTDALLEQLKNILKLKEQSKNEDE